MRKRIKFITPCRKSFALYLIPYQTVRNPVSYENKIIPMYEICRFWYCLYLIYFIMNSFISINSKLGVIQQLMHDIQGGLLMVPRYWLCVKNDMQRHFLSFWPQIEQSKHYHATSK